MSRKLGRFVFVAALVTAVLGAAFIPAASASDYASGNPGQWYTVPLHDDPESGGGGMIGMGATGNTGSAGASQYSSFYGSGYMQNTSSTVYPVDTRLWFGRASYKSRMTGAYNAAQRFSSQVGGAIEEASNGYYVYYTAMVPK